MDLRLVATSCAVFICFFCMAIAAVACFCRSFRSSQRESGQPPALSDFEDEVQQWRNQASAPGEAGVSEVWNAWDGTFRGASTRTSQRRTAMQQDLSTNRQGHGGSMISEESGQEPEVPARQTGSYTFGPPAGAWPTHQEPYSMLSEPTRQSDTSASPPASWFLPAHQEHGSMISEPARQSDTFASPPASMFLPAHQDDLPPSVLLQPRASMADMQADGPSSPRR